MKRAFTLVEAVVVVAILLTLVGLLWPAISAARSAASRGSDGVTHAINEPTESWNLHTVRHDGHWFVEKAGGGVCHHPDCPCSGKVER
jgi:competence protein ComGC